MGVRQEKETLIFLINVGTTKSGGQSNLPLLEKAKSIVQKLIEKKIFLRPDDEIGILLMGSDATKNLAGKEHVEELSGIQIPTWDLVEQVINLKGTANCCSWIDGVYAAVEYIHENADFSTKKEATFPPRKIVLLSDFKEDPDTIQEFKEEELAEALNMENIQLLAMGEEAIDEKPEDSLTASEVFLKELFKKVPGQYITFDSAAADLSYYRHPPKVSARWRSNLEIGDIQIPIFTCIQVTDTSTFPPWKLAKDGKKVASVQGYIDKRRVSYDKGTITRGFKWGGVFHPISEHEESMCYYSGPKSYKLIAFTKKDNVGLQFWCDGSNRLVLPDDPSADEEFYSLLQAMEQNDMVALVRKVHARDYTPRVVALFPCIGVPDEPWCLVEVLLPFAEDRRVAPTKPLRSVAKRLTKEQIEVINRFCDALSDSASESEDGPSFLPGSMPNPALQNRWHMLSFRALHPKEPLPKMEDYLRRAFDVPSKKETCKDLLQTIKSLYCLEIEIPEKKGKRAHAKDESPTVHSKIFKDDAADEEKNNVKDEPDDEIPDDLVMDESADLDDLASKI